MPSPVSLEEYFIIQEHLSDKPLILLTFPASRPGKRFHYNPDYTSKLRKIYVIFI
jgi:hypothetical protein